MFISIGGYLLRTDLILYAFKCDYDREYYENGIYTKVGFTDGTTIFLEVTYDDFLLALTNMLNGGFKNDSKNENN